MSELCPNFLAAARGHDGVLGRDPRGVLELVDDVTVGLHRQRSAVPKLARDVDTLVLPITAQGAIRFGLELASPLVPPDRPAVLICRAQQALYRRPQGRYM